MSTNKAPSAGTKVDLGRNAPTKQEGVGAVGSESLAAESYRGGGEFASNGGSQPENLSTSDYNTSSSGATKLESTRDTSYTSLNESSSNVDTAPSYVNNQYVRDTSGPHGKNIQEGFDDAGARDGLKAALAAEPGSKDDPSRLAEQQFKTNQFAPSRDGGPKQTSLSNETKYDALNETSA